ncbi:DUF3888 domain-containing protein [Clostridium cellulovorans]|uniref:DUF3888 domain-containing protein n=1 Tax=Clostridium cellulovorans (strain ATCC 35296 / DSM 3052 / OCM 3 / 743B) TaxID=573061 RepID=D9SVN9_CLOC7|nr:DUF3888 domain-containing protein [Clostridium cellulovorans]ADL53100.1 hypothetical protein Clocel_3421 [Clostridium cellulovorans 743B]
MKKFTLVLILSMLLTTFSSSFVLADGKDKGGLGKYYGDEPLYQNLYEELLTPEITKEIGNYYGQYYNYDINKIDILNVYRSYDNFKVRITTTDKEKKIIHIDEMTVEINEGKVTIKDFKHISSRKI